MPVEVAIYTRISRDHTGQQTATKRQERDCRAFAELRGWEVVEVYEDVDLSAYKANVERPAYERLLAEVRAETIGGVLCWKLDRLVRRPSDFEALWEECQRAHVILASATEPVDSSTELGLAVVRILVTFANLESATKSVRLKAKFRDNALAGKTVDFGPVPYGYSNRARTKLRIKEATVLHEAAERVLAGDSVNTITDDLNRRRVPSPGGRQWTGSSLRRMLLNPLRVGDRAYYGDVVAKGSWEPIFDRATFDQVGAVLRLPAREGTIGSLRSRYPLSPVLRCGRCGYHMSGSLRPTASGKRRCYKCHPRPYGCARVQIQADLLEEFLLDALVAYLDGPHLRRAIDEECTAVTGREPEELRVLGERLSQLDLDHHHLGALDRHDYKRVRRSLMSKIDRARARLELGLRFPALVRLWGTGDSIRAEWAEATLQRQRQIVVAAVDHVTVAPTHRGGRYDQQKRVKIHWRL